jgi:hypothetical protein
MLREDFEQNGANVIRRVRERKPEAYLASVVSLLPRQTQVERRSPFDDVSDEELDLLEEHPVAVRAKTIKARRLREKTRRVWPMRVLRILTPSSYRPDRNPAVQRLSGCSFPFDIGRSLLQQLCSSRHPPA